MGAKELTENLRKMSAEDLADFQAAQATVPQYAILAEKEFERRARQEQHKLDLELVVKQGQWMKFSAILGIVGTIAGAIIGALLIYSLQDKPPPKQLESPRRASQQEKVPAKTANHTEKAESVPSKSP